MRSIEIKKDEESGDYFIDFDKISDMFEHPDEVVSYKLEFRDDNSVAISFFDKDDNIVYPIKKE